MYNTCNKNKELIIPEEIFGSDLLCYLFPSKFENQEIKTAAIVLHKICYASPNDFEKKENITK
jgi:hypothetical protein